MHLLEVNHAEQPIFDRSRCDGGICLNIAFICAGIAFIALVAFSWIYHSQQAAWRISCRNQFKSVSLAMRMFSNDHKDQFPWQITGDALGAATSTVSHFFALASNEVCTPKILVCPADNRIRVASFERFGDSNLSYFVGIDARESNSTAIMLGDRNVAGGLSSGSQIRSFDGASTVDWTDELHRGSGNIAMADGSVEMVQTLKLVLLIQSNVPSTFRLAFP